MAEATTKERVNLMLNRVTSELDTLEVDLIKMQERRGQLIMRRGELQDIRDSLKEESQ